MEPPAAIRPDQSAFRLNPNGIVALLVVCSPLFVLGCQSRAKHFQRADRLAHRLIQEKSSGKPWAVPSDYSLIPRADSRLAVQDCVVSPRLPDATNSLYGYDLPPLRSALEPGAEQPDSVISQPGLIANPVPPDAWEAIPQQCLERMLDFESIKGEAESTMEEYPDFSIQSDAAEDVPKLTLEDVVDLALLNSRDYQTQKENLYLVALQLSQERFAYQSKFTNGGTGTDLDYSHIRSGGTTVNTLLVPTGISRDRLLVTGGDLFASFANNVFLTFNGPSGFAADVSSSMLLSYTQPLLQRDIRFESLTQAERNVVYAARDFARFRKQFFVDFAQIYYSLILDYRRIEIDSQNYFSLVRAFNQAQAEFQTNFVPRVQVDQVEQRLLAGRGSLISICNQVEQSLDRLKLSIGLPTETAINVNLKELNELTRLDQLSVSANSSSRVLKRLKASLPARNRKDVVNESVQLLQRLIEAADLASQNEESTLKADLDKQIARLLIDEARIASEEEGKNIENRTSPNERLQLSTEFQRTLAHSRSLLDLNVRQLEYGALVETAAVEQATRLEGFRRRQELYLGQIIALDAEFEGLFKPQANSQDVRISARVQELLRQAKDLRGQILKLVEEADQAIGILIIDDIEQDRQRIIAQATELVAKAEETLGLSDFGLKPIDIDVDDAMITAIVLRFDLMNQRETVFDDWRQIKLAADELKSVLDINASHRINTRSGANQPLNFTFDDSLTRVGFNFDAPLNRFAERNTFRATLITYQRALRNLALLEDNVKFSVRNDLRSLALDREQYLIDVASAALAYERVVSTSLEFRLGTGGVTARDFLEAQTDYTSALTSVAGRHIAYIVDRTQLFLDLELLTVDETGFWDDLRSEDLQPQAVYSIPGWADPVYGTLPRVKYSKEMRRLMCLPPCNSPTPFGTQVTTEAGDLSVTPSEIDAELDSPALQVPVPPEPIPQVPLQRTPIPRVEELKAPPAEALPLPEPSEADATWLEERKRASEINPNPADGRGVSLQGPVLRGAAPELQLNGPYPASSPSRSAAAPVHQAPQPRW